MDEFPNAKLVAGVDEAGRGPLAGSVVAAAVILDNSHVIEGLTDSKKLSAAKRKRLDLEIRQYAIAGPIEMDTNHTIFLSFWLEIISVPAVT